MKAGARGAARTERGRLERIEWHIRTHRSPLVDVQKPYTMKSADDTKCITYLM